MSEMESSERAPARAGDQFLGELDTGINAVHHLHDRFDFLAEISVRHLKSAASAILG